MRDAKRHSQAMTSSFLNLYSRSRAMVMVNDCGHDLQDPVFVGVTFLSFVIVWVFLFNVKRNCSAWLIN